MQLPFQIEQHDAVGLTHCAGTIHSFAKVESTKKMDEELTREKDSSTIRSAYLLAQLHGKENVDPSMLNFDRKKLLKIRSEIEHKTKLMWSKQRQSMPNEWKFLTHV